MHAVYVMLCSIQFGHYIEIIIPMFAADESVHCLAVEMLLCGSLFPAGRSVTGKMSGLRNCHKSQI